MSDVTPGVSDQQLILVILRTHGLCQQQGLMVRNILSSFMTNLWLISTL